MFSCLTGSLFSVFKGVALVVFAATAGASSCFFLSKLIGQLSLSGQRENTIGCKEKGTAFELHAIPGITPTLPNTFINFAAPIVNVPYHIFFLATVIGLIPTAYVTVRAGIALADLQSVKDLYDFQSIATLFFIGVVSIMPTLTSKKDS